MEIGYRFCFLFCEDWCKLIDKCVCFTDVCCCWDARGSLQRGDALVLFTERFYVSPELVWVCFKIFFVEHLFEVCLMTGCNRVFV